MNLHEFLRAMPKVSLHCHLEGSVQARTVVDLAAKHGVQLPPFREPADLYDYPDILKFLAMYDVVAHVVRDADDFHRITYETLQEAHAHGVRYREMFWSPMAHMEIGVPYRTALDGVVAGIRDAARDFGLECRLIADINRMQPPEAGLALVEQVLADRRDEVIGLGLDYAETGFPPEIFWKAFRLAAKHGLRLTAHACEEGPPRNVETCLDLLGCERIDHGYHVIEDERLTARCAAEGVVFNCTPVSTAWVYFGNDFARHPIRRMVAAGLKITVDCDDPPMFKTDPTRDYLVMADHMGFGPEDFRGFVSNAIDGCWLDEPTKRICRREWLREIDRLAAEVVAAPEPAPASGK
jgi:adenosine deaminase